MRFTWAIWYRDPRSGLTSDWRGDGRGGHGNAPTPEALVAGLDVTLAAGEKLMVWASPGVGQAPVLVVEGDKP